MAHCSEDDRDAASNAAQDPSIDLLGILASLGESVAFCAQGCADLVLPGLTLPRLVRLSRQHRCRDRARAVEFNMPFEICQGTALADKVINEDIVHARSYDSFEGCLVREARKTRGARVGHNICLHYSGIHLEVELGAETIGQCFRYCVYTA